MLKHSDAHGLIGRAVISADASPDDADAAKRGGS
jgi:hypothetical protein